MGEDLNSLLTKGFPLYLYLSLGRKTHLSGQDPLKRVSTVFLIGSISTCRRYPKYLLVSNGNYSSNDT